MPIFGYSEQQMEKARRKAQRALVDNFEDNISSRHGHQQGREVLIGLLYDLKGYRTAHWISTLPDKLVALVDRLLEKNTSLKDNLRHEKRQREQLEWELEDYQRNPLQKQVRELTKRRDRWCDETLHLRKRAQQLDEALERCRTMYQNETQRLQNRVNELNIIIAEQEQRINAFRN
jgi:chromosome segregation ATPase